MNPRVNRPTKAETAQIAISSDIIPRDGNSRLIREYIDSEHFDEHDLTRTAYLLLRRFASEFVLLVDATGPMFTSIDPRALAEHSDELAVLIASLVYELKIKNNDLADNYAYARDRLAEYEEIAAAKAKASSPKPPRARPSKSTMSRSLDGKCLKFWARPG
jgi:hypothetical protein